MLFRLWPRLLSSAAVESVLRRAAVVKIAWDQIDTEGKGVVSISRLSECYDVSRNSDFIDGKMTKEQIF